MQNVWQAQTQQRWPSWAESEDIMSLFASATQAACIAIMVEQTGGVTQVVPAQITREGKHILSLKSWVSCCESQQQNEILKQLQCIP